MILQLLHEEPTHGYVLMQRIQQILGLDNLPPSGTIYTLLRRLEKRGLLQSKWDVKSSNINRRIYTLTPQGELHLKNGLYMLKLRRPIFDYLISYFESHFSNENKKETKNEEENKLKKEDTENGIKKEEKV
ncbi:MAG: PadR family transcriptional regulator [Promethearchaeota archaeon]